jgi:negative regulator of sigma E activity
VSAHERERLSAYLDGELSPEERVEVEVHLDACGECRAFLAQMEAVDDAARGLPIEAPPRYFEGFPGRVRARIEAEASDRARSAASRARWRVPAWAWPAAAALVVALVIPFVLPPMQRSQRPPSQRPAATASPPAAIATPSLPVPKGPAPPGAPATLDESRAETDRPAETAPPEAGRGFAPPPPAATPAPSRRVRREELPAAPEPAPVARDRAAAPRKAAGPPAGGDRPALAESEAFEGTRAPGPEPDVVPQAATHPAGPAEDALARSAIAPAVAEGERHAFGALGAASGAEQNARLFTRLAAEAPGDADGWRELRETWRAFVAAHPGSQHVDEARVRTIEAGLEAWRLDGDPADLARAITDADAYLARDDAQQRSRVRGAIADAEGR